MKVSYVIVTHNRKDVLLRTLGIITSMPAPPAGVEFIVVDNGSTDGTADAARKLFPNVLILRRTTNEGVSARNHGFTVAGGEYVVLIDDDSYPLADAVERSTAYLDAHPKTGAVVGRVVLPNGRCEASAFPTVMINCAVCIRRSVLSRVGGFPTDFFRQAEEYDLSFRCWEAGFAIERFEDIVYRHDKSPGNRASSLVHKLDIRNNLILVDRFLPRELRKYYRRDWARRYLALAQYAGHLDAAWEGLSEARELARFIARHDRQTLSPATIELIFQFNNQSHRVTKWVQQHNIHRVLIADFSKNIHATFQACTSAGVQLLGITDNNPAYDGLTYRGLCVGQDAMFLAKGAEGIVLSNINPAQMESRASALSERFGIPVLTLWTPRNIADTEPHAEAQAA